MLNGCKMGFAPLNPSYAKSNMAHMRIGRRQFAGLLGSAILAAPRAVSQTRQLPLIGFLHAATAESYASDAAGFAQGLEEQGFVEAQNLAVDYRFANGQRDRLAMLAADLGRCPVALIVAGGAVAARAARAATRSEEHTSELQSPCNLVCRLLLEKKKKN